MATGTVKWFNVRKHYGFIEQDGGGKDVFMHESGVVSGTVKEGDRVEFEVKQDEKGLKAINVKKVQ